MLEHTQTHTFAQSPSGLAKPIGSKVLLWHLIASSRICIFLPFGQNPTIRGIDTVILDEGIFYQNGLVI